MEKNNLRIVLKRVGKNPEVINIENTLKAKQRLVGGLIEIFPVTDDILLICNEEGKLDNLLPNLIFEYDYIAGDCFFVGDDYKKGDFKSLTNQQIEEVKTICKNRDFVNFFDLEDSKGKELEQ